MNLFFRIQLKAFGLLCWFFLSLSSAAYAGELTEAEALHVKREVLEMTKRFFAGDVDLVVSRTHKSVSSMVGGKEELKKISLSALDLMKERGIVFTDPSAGSPSTTYAAGPEEICFVPVFSAVDIKGKKFKSTSFMVAVRKVNGKAWSYIDGSYLKNDPSQLYQLLPNLKPLFGLPPVTFEAL